MIRLAFKYRLHVLGIFILFAFPLFYYVYKFGVLLEGYDDARYYLLLFENLNSPSVPAPFNGRILTAALVHLLEKTGFMYNTQCAIDAFPHIDKRFFFNGVFFNYICIVCTSLSIYIVFQKLDLSKILSFLCGISFLLGFGTIFYLMMPGVDALSVLMFTWVVYFYQKKSYWIVGLFALLIFQREYYFLVFMIIALFDFIKFSFQRYFLFVFLASVISFLIYYILRKTVFFTPHWNHQTSPAFLLSSFFDIQLNVTAMIRQTLMTMNLYLIYLLVIIYKVINKISFNRYYLLITLAILAQITILSFAATFGNNNGRYFYLIIPLILYYLAIEIQVFFQTLPDMESLEPRESGNLTVEQ
jgi:hypothetical protein